MICPVCATGVASWLLAGGLGTSSVAAAAIHWRRKKATHLQQDNDDKLPKPEVLHDKPKGGST